MSQVKIEVTQEDIDRGVCGNATRCAVARAIRRIVGKRNIEVTQNNIAVNSDFDVAPPKKVRDFIDKFDANKKSVKPFSFVLRGYKGKVA